MSLAGVLMILGLLIFPEFLLIFPNNDDSCQLAKNSKADVSQSLEDVLLS